jgi:hypothetical protein
MCGGNAPADTNPYCARSWAVICVTAAHVLGSGLRNTPKRNWYSTSVRPSLIPQTRSASSFRIPWLTVPSRDTAATELAGALGAADRPDDVRDGKNAASAETLQHRK